MGNPFFKLLRIYKGFLLEKKILYTLTFALKPPQEKYLVDQAEIRFHIRRIVFIYHMVKLHINGLQNTPSNKIFKISIL